MTGVADGQCARCGTLNPVDHLHCVSCGARLPWQPMGVVAPPKPMDAPRPVKGWPKWATGDQKIRAALAGLEGFSSSQAMISVDNKTGLAVDEASRKICLIEVGADANKPIIHRRLFGYADLVGTEVVEDGFILASTSGPPGSGTPAGPPGSLSDNMGGFLGLPTRSRAGEKAETVALKIVINDRGTPLVHIVKFMQRLQDKGSDHHRAAMAKAQHWYHLMNALMSLNALISVRSQTKF